MGIWRRLSVQVHRSQCSFGSTVLFLGLCREVHLFLILLAVLQCRPNRENDVPKLKQEVWCQNQGIVIIRFTASFSFSFSLFFFFSLTSLPFVLLLFLLLSDSIFFSFSSFSLTPYPSLPFSPSPLFPLPPFLCLIVYHQVDS